MDVTIVKTPNSRRSVGIAVVIIFADAMVSVLADDLNGAHLTRCT
jgi:hypothetical protein